MTNKAVGLAGATEALAESLRDARIIVVDDDRAHCSHLERVVAEWGALPFVANTLSDAIRLHRESKPDLIILDVMMRHMDGYKLAQMFKRDSVFVPIILLTSLDDIESKRRGLAAGADEFLVKPVDTLELQIRVSSMLRIKRLADQLETANRGLEALAMVDPLTRLPNRRALDLRFSHELARTKRYRKHLGCLLLDVDHFKKVNDIHGHLVGDQVLVEVAAAIAANVRATDLGGRFGGEEFLVLAPETSRDQAEILAERLRVGVVARMAGMPHLPAVTVSIGVATTELPHATADDLVHRADEALYAAKRGGRNRVVCAE
jgi:two-component system, cell cycle response regulator